MSFNPDTTGDGHGITVTIRWNGDAATLRRAFSVILCAVDRACVDSEDIADELGIEPDDIEDAFDVATCIGDALTREEPASYPDWPPHPDLAVDIAGALP